MMVAGVRMFSRGTGFLWFLIALAILIPIDVALRRIQIDWYAITSLFQRQKQTGPATATMGTLLQRKQDIGTRLDKSKSTAARTAVQQTARPKTAIPGTTPSAAARKKSAPDRKGPAETPSSGTTTGKLLAMKRKRQEEDD